MTTGSIRLVGELIAAGLVDEYRLFTYPVVLVRGQRLFADATEVPRLRLVETQPFAPASCSCATGQPDGAPASRCTASALDDRRVSRERGRRSGC